MNRNTTGRDIQRNDFIENLYKSINKKTKEVLASKERWTKMAREYISDGMDAEECVELLIIDGLSKEAAASYVKMANDDLIEEAEYSFQFEDSFGRVWSSSDLNKFISASSDEDAWNKSSEYIFSEAEDYNPEKIISVNKISGQQPLA